MLRNKVIGLLAGIAIISWVASQGNTLTYIKSIWAHSSGDIQKTSIVAPLTDADEQTMKRAIEQVWISMGNTGANNISTAQEDKNANDSKILYGSVKQTFDKNQPARPTVQPVKQPADKPESQSASQLIVKTHTVAAGENLWIVARAYYGDRAARVFYLLADANGLKDPYSIKVGQLLKIPDL